MLWEDCTMGAWKVASWVTRTASKRAIAVNMKPMTLPCTQATKGLVKLMRVRANVRTWAAPSRANVLRILVSCRSNARMALRSLPVQKFFPLALRMTALTYNIHFFVDLIVGLGIQKNLCKLIIHCGDECIGLGWSVERNPQNVLL